MGNTIKSTSNHLKTQVQSIANDLQHGYASDEGEDVNGYDYLSDAFDIEYIVSSKKQFLGARVCVAFGGPNIWINTKTQTVEGYWWGETEFASYSHDSMDIESVLGELWECC
tara:strand:+ start:267 stop:602 length:336 start_codon:yes stop_codon:yes gene_type:complete